MIPGGYHTPSDASDPTVRTLCDAITMGDAVARSTALGADEDAAKLFDCSESCERLGMPAGSLEKLSALLGERLQAAMAAYE